MTCSRKQVEDGQPPGSLSSARCGLRTPLARGRKMLLELGRVHVEGVRSETCLADM